MSQSNKLTEGQNHRSTRPFQDNEDGTELQPMVRQKHGICIYLPANVLAFMFQEEGMEVIKYLLTSHSNKYAVPSSLFFLLLLSLLRKPSASAKWMGQIFFSSFFTFHILPSRGRDSLACGKGVEDKCYSESLSHACCSKVRRVVRCLISCQNC